MARGTPVASDEEPVERWADDSSPSPRAREANGTNGQGGRDDPAVDLEEPIQEETGYGYGV